MYLLGVFTYFCFFSSSVAALPVSSRIHPRPSTGTCYPCLLCLLIEENNSSFFFGGKIALICFEFLHIFDFFLVFSCSISSFK